MTNQGDTPFRDEEITAYIDGELGAQRAGELERAMAGDDELAARVAFFRSVSGALELGLAVDDEDVKTPDSASPFRALWPSFLVLAAAAIVAVIGFWPEAPIRDSIRGVNQKREKEGEQDPGTSTLKNDLLVVRALPLRGASWPIWSDVAIELKWLSLVEGDVHVIGDDKMLKELPAKAVPVILDAEIRSPNGDVVRAKWRSSYPVKTAGDTLGQRTPLWQFKFEDETIAPLVAAAPDGEAWKEDFRWGFGAVGGPQMGVRGFVPQELGEYSLKLTIRSPQPAEGQAWLTFEDPLVLESAFRVTGFATGWSKPVDGISARLLASSKQMTGRGTAAFGLQLRNDSDRARTYNVTGVTRAEIPQPLHMTLLVDGQPWVQRDDLKVITMAGTLFLPQSVGSTRSIVVLPSYWRQDGKSLHELMGKHELQLRFDFKPSLWNAANRAIWMGKVDTPGLEIDVRRSRR